MREGENDYIEIVVPEYLQGVSLKGIYYYRSGSTNQTLNGIALQEFFNRKHGVTWDASLMPNVKVEDLSKKPFKYLRIRLQRRKGSTLQFWRMKIKLFFKISV